jgi:glutathionyl-hydroquinone reductase
MLARVLTHRHLPIQSPLCTRLHSSFIAKPIRPPATRRIMSRDVSHQSDISKSKNEDDGQFRRKDAQFRDSITDDGKFTPEKGRYRLYVSYACREWVAWREEQYDITDYTTAWATRTLIVRQLKGLEDIIRMYHLSTSEVSDR